MMSNELWRRQFLKAGIGLIAGGANAVRIQWYKDYDQPTRDWNFSGLTPYEKNLVNNPIYGLKATAQRSTAFGV